MKMHLHEVVLPLRHPFATTHGVLHEKRNLLVELRDEEISGWGEAAPSLAYPHITVATIRKALETHRDRIEATTWSEPSELWTALDQVLAADRFAQCALDVAAHDLWGKRLGQPVWQLWGQKLDHLPLSNYTIGLDRVERMVAKLAEFADWPIFKIKLGTAQDLQIVCGLRRHTTARFRVDANTGWTVEQTLRDAPELAKLGVEFIEQPLRVEDWAGMRRLIAECPLPLFADESCQTESDVARCHGHFHGINVKLSKAGGLTPARRMLTAAKALGLRCMAGCMVETTIGISAQAQLLPWLDAVDLDGALLLGKDLAEGVSLEKGRAIFPSTPGTGVHGVRLA